MCATLFGHEFCPIVLQSDILTVMDNTREGINLKRVKFIMQLLSNLNKRRLGVKTAIGSAGTYSFEGEKHTLQSLSTLEAELIQSPLAKDSIRLEKLQKYCQNVQEEIIDLLIPHILAVNDMKTTMITLITEWASNANRLDSLLLQWNAIQEGQEAAAIKTAITTFKELDQFCADITYFLQTLLRSCPKAFTDFQKIVQK